MLSFGPDGWRQDFISSLNGESSPLYDPVDRIRSEFKSLLEVETQNTVAEVMTFEAARQAAQLSGCTRWPARLLSGDLPGCYPVTCQATGYPGRSGWDSVALDADADLHSVGAEDTWIRHTQSVCFCSGSPRIVSLAEPGEIYNGSLAIFILFFFGRGISSRVLIYQAKCSRLAVLNRVSILGYTILWQYQYAMRSLIADGKLLFTQPCFLFLPFFKTGSDTVQVSSCKQECIIFHQCF